MLQTGRRTRLFATAIIILSVSLGLAGQGGTIRYVYDGAGRLAGVIDAAGNVATYHYDAVGNLIAITRTTAGTVAIVQFTPNSGAVGDAIMIYGSGFGPTPSDNTVRLNGIVTTITEASPTKLVVTVPSGATSGDIAVTAPLGTVTSFDTYMVRASNAPTIVSMTPNVGVSGSTTTVAGEHFDVATPSNRLTFNHVLTPAYLASGTTTSLLATVPAGATTGRLQLSTPNGAVLSLMEFFVPPPPYTGSSVSFTGHVTPTQAVTVSIPIANHIAMVAFDGISGHRISTNVTSASTGNTGYSLLKPDGSALYSALTVFSTGFIDTRTLPTDGTYALVVDPIGTGVGNATMTFYDVPPDPIVPIVAGGAAVTAGTTVPGQNAQLTFDASANQRVSVQLSGISFVHTFKALKPDGTQMYSAFQSGSAGWVDTLTLPDAGPYTLLIDGSGAGIGNVTVKLNDVPPDVTAAIAPDGQAQAITVTVPGQNARLSFAGLAQQRVSLKIANSGIPSTYTILTSAGTTVSSDFKSASADFIDVKTLPANDTYTLSVDPNTTFIGSATLTMYSVTDVAGQMTIGDSPTALAITTPGQNAQLTFAGTAGQAVTLHVTNNTMLIPMSSTFRILKPDGSQLTSGFTWGQTFNLSATLPATGTYVVVVDPASTATGSCALQISTP